MQVKQIILFLYKKWWSALWLIFDLLREYDGEFDIDLLNSSLLPSVKQNIIYKINNPITDNKKETMFPLIYDWIVTKNYMNDL